MKLALATAVVFLGFAGLFIPSVAGAASGPTGLSGPTGTSSPTGAGPTGTPGPIHGGCHPVDSGPTGAGPTGSSSPHIICYSMLAGGPRHSAGGVVPLAASKSTGLSVVWWFVFGTLAVLALIVGLGTRRKLASRRR